MNLGIFKKKKQKIWIFKAWIFKVYDRAGKRLIDWEFGDRLSQNSNDFLND
ncbi:hypothetical protein HE1_00578 [Holospora elegans E1]|uniref:Uncharacterized protein n=1 Tax=Holospora elegans E1 TaxID=1427503 RepID=A0A023DZC3_9PROT|nr:hypothetical protein HE1_00578 [Holospora elegans E1]